MNKLEYTVRFMTPAFLGNAEQQGQWRTPPFKALLRQWWRVVKAKDVGYAHEKLRDEEARLFGAASDAGASKSRVRLRLSSWNMGTLRSWTANPGNVHHREVGPNGRAVRADLYLGYGPLTYNRDTGVALNQGRTAIDAQQPQRLTIQAPEENGAEIYEALRLAHLFGTLGSRSRNGWGSICLEGEGLGAGLNKSLLDGAEKDRLRRYARRLADCLELDWPHAVGMDGQGLLIWRTGAKQGRWEAVVNSLATAKIDFRVSGLPFQQTVPGRFADRHLVAYPVTNHPIGDWGGDSRLANALRFKVLETSPEEYVGIVVHLPCGLPRPLAKKLKGGAPGIPAQQDIWAKVHARLDHTFERIA